MRLRARTPIVVSLPGQVADPGLTYGSCEPAIWSSQLLARAEPVSIGRPVTRGLGYSSGPSMASEAGTSPEGQLDRHTVAVDFLLSRSRALETRLDSLGEGVAGLASLCSDWEARLLQVESSLTWLSSQVVLFDSKQQAFEHSFSHRVEEEFSEALSALHLRIDNLCRQRADLGAQFGHLSRRVDLIAGFAEATDSEFSLHTLD